MTKFQAYLTGLIIFFVGVALLITGLVLKESVLSATGTFLIGTGLGGLGLPRPSDTTV
jgi:hypothetical protein